MIELIKQRFFWPKMYNDVKYFLIIIGKCIKEKTPNTYHRHHSRPSHFLHPWNLLELDTWN